MASSERCPDFAALLREAEADAALYEQIAQCFHGELSRQARRRCGDETLAEDAAQDALVLALESLDSFRGDAPIDHWLKRLVVSACARLRRGRKNDPGYNRPLDEVGPVAASDGRADGEVAAMLSERVALLREALDELPEDNRALLLLHEGREMPITELASRFGLSVDGVKSRLKRTRARMRSRLIALAESGP